MSEPNIEGAVFRPSTLGIYLLKKVAKKFPQTRLLEVPLKKLVLLRIEVTDRWEKEYYSRLNDATFAFVKKNFVEKQEYRILIKHCFLMGKTSEQSLQWLQKCYPTSAPSRTTVYRWFSEFKMGRTSTEDAPRSGRPKEATNAEIVKQVHRIVLSDRKVKLRELAEVVGISKERAGYILHDLLEMKKLSARWVPRLLTVDQKQQRVDDSTAAMAKLDQLRFELVAHPPYSPDLVPSDYYLFPNLKRWLQGKRFRSNEEVIAETEAYFEGLDVSYYRKSIEMLENRYTKCIALEGNYVEE
ncbi:PREDICTED: histone-lysine N-methyltransferase SETMAR-like [Trachymyrmex septentrionalis]|uniref:histone-lysine N-methyltransferase SETMAR-like n=1 Tax=Trachymyrmex septentrionalis TaxID=34720 RepID=UPI00084EDCC2|nr:PREDICTED: histone-lysine N-methyltransferase SETMAR-like [Trachymyrmex septentrionalis]